MDIQQIIKDKLEEIVSKVKGNKDILAKFKKDPIATVKSLIDFDLDNDQLKTLADAVAAKLDLDKAKGIFGKLGSLFGKK